MARLFFGNFDFEQTLAGQSRSALLQRLNAELASSWLTIADDGDWLFTPEPIPAEFFETSERTGLPRVRPVTDLAAIDQPVNLVPWGWTAELCRLAGQYASGDHIPDPRVVRHVNSRAYSVDLASRLGCLLPGERLIERVEELADALRGLPDPTGHWVLKANFSMSGRERMLGRGTPTESQRNWLKRRLQRREPVSFEPWLRRVEEVGLQWDVPPTGDPQLLGVVPLLCDPRGQYAGSAFSDERATDPTWQTAIDMTQQAACELQRLGYFGPLGIDAMRYQLANGEIGIRPLQDVNARWTMGRLSLGCRRFLQPGETGIWRHGTATALQNQAGDSRKIVTSPEQVGNVTSQHRHWMEFASWE